MIRYRVSLLLLLIANFQLATLDDASQIAEDKSSNPKPPDKLILQKSQPYAQGDDLIDTLTNWIKNPFATSSSEEKKSSEDLTASAAEYIGAKYLPPVTNFKGHGRSCYECNSEPWIPIVGRSLHFAPPSSHSNSLEESLHHNGNNKQFNIPHHHQPPIDQYGAPQGSFDFPPVGEVVDFMLPPRYKQGNAISALGSSYGAPSGSYGAPSISYGTPSASYGAPKPSYGPPRAPQTIYGSPKPSFSSVAGNGQHFLNLSPPPLHQKLPPPIYRAPAVFKSPSLNYGVPLGDTSASPVLNYGPPPTPSRTYLPSQNYGPPSLPSNSYGPPLRQPIPTTQLRPVSQDFQPPLPGGGIDTLPLENNLPPAEPSDSYGRPVTTDHLLPSAPPSDSYGAPITSGQQGYVEPITLGSGDSEDYGKQVAFKSQNHFLNFESQQSAEIKASLYQKGLTDVQVVPSVRIADYTASIEHPINLIQSPILDLNVKDQDTIIEQVSKNFQTSAQQSSHEHSDEHQENGYNLRNKLSESPIIVDDTFTSASDINTTYSAEDNSTVAVKRHNDKFLSSESFEDKLKEADLTDELIQKLILEHNIIEDPKTQIVGIQKTVINPQKVQTNLNVVQPSVDYSSWAPAYHSTIPTIMVPPKPSATTWLTPVNESFVAGKHSKKLKIIVPYLKAPENNLHWNNKPPQQHSTAIYNREYTTLAPVFIPPPMSTEPSSLWTQLIEDIRTAESHREPAQGFAKSSSTTEVYNIKDFLAKQHKSNHLPYDIISLQKNIDDWTHQSYSNRHNLEGRITTKLEHVKKIPGEYFTTTPSYSDNTISSGAFGESKDHEVASSNNKEFISKEIEDNLIFPEKTFSSTVKPTPKTTLASVRFVVRQPKPVWDGNKVTLSNSTHEKVYVVTPQSYNRFLTSTPATAYSMAPRIQNGKVNNVPTMTKISVRVETPSDTGNGKALKPVKVVYSEWPHLINSLATTTTSRPTSRHPLFGLMDLAPYTAPPNSTVETIGGHSKVTSIVTSPIVKYTSTTPMPRPDLNKTVKISPVP